MAHRNVDVYQQAYDAFLKGDTEMLSAVIAPDIVWHEAGDSGPLRGRDAVIERMSAATGLDPDVEVHDIIANDDHVVALIRARLRKPNGDEVSYPAVEVAHIRDGMIAERWSFMDASPDDVAAFFADLG